MEEELDAVLNTIKTRKAAGLDEILPEVWETRKFDDIFFDYATLYIYIYVCVCLCVCMCVCVCV